MFEAAGLTGTRCAAIGIAIRPGATLHGRATIEQTRASKSRPALGLVRVFSELTDDAGDVVLSMRSWGMFGRRPA